HPHRIVWDNNRKISKQRVVDMRRRASSQSKQRRRGKQAWKKREDKVETKLGRTPNQVVIQERRPGMLSHDPQRNAFEVPKGVKRRPRHQIPYTPLNSGAANAIEDWICGSDGDPP